MDAKKLDVIICGKQIIDSNSNGFPDRIKSTSNGWPVILITSESSAKKMNEIKDMGINYVLSSPFSSVELRSMILDACDLRTRRAHERISIPDTKVIEHLDDFDLGGEVVNISESGILCDFVDKNINSELINRTHISVLFPIGFRNTAIRNLSCKLLRLNVLGWNDEMFPECSPNHIRVVWQIVNMSFEDKKRLTDILKIAETNITNKLH